MFLFRSLLCAFLLRIDCHHRIGPSVSSVGSHFDHDAFNGVGSMPVGAGMLILEVALQQHPP